MRTLTTSSPTSSEPSRRPSSVVALVAWLALAAVQTTLAFASTGGGGVPEEPLYEWELAVGGAIVYAFLIGLTFAIATAYPDPREAIGIRRFSSRWVWIALGVVVASLIVAVALEPILHGGEKQGLTPEEWRPEAVWALAANAVVVVAIGPFAEELFFRGLGVTALGFLGATGAIVGTAIAFGLAHGILAALPPLVFFALGLAWVRLRSGSVWPGFIAHAAYNGAGLVAALATLE